MTTKTTTNRRTTETADAAYHAHLTTARAQLALIADRLSAHTKLQAVDARNWGYVGDLGSVVKTLGEALQGLGL